MVDNENNYMGECNYWTIHDFQNIKGLVIVHNNIGYINAEKFADVRINLVSENTDVLCLTESGLGVNDEIGSYHIPGFRVYRQDRDLSKGKNRWGGLQTYIRENLFSS